MIKWYLQTEMGIKAQVLWNRWQVVENVGHVEEDRGGTNAGITQAILFSLDSYVYTYYSSLK